MWKYLKIMVWNWLQRSVNREPDMSDKDVELEMMIESAIDQCRERKHAVSLPFRNGDVYAYPVPGAPHAIYWGVNGGRYGFCVLQGLRDTVTGDDRRWQTGNPQ